MHTFDYRFLRGLNITPELSKRLSRIEVFRDRVSAFEKDNPDTVEDMVRMARIMSTRESNAIEGIGTEDRRIYSLLADRVQPMGHDENELLGYRDALAMIHGEHARLDIDAESILRIYSVMVSRIGVDPAFKKVNNEVVERDGTGRIVKRFKTVPAADTEDAVYQLTAAYMEARGDMGIDPILLIPCFVLDFLKVHPFLDGNGRMSRLLTALLLCQEGYGVCAYVSIEALINKTKDEYYDALERSGEGWFDDLNDYYPFIDYFIGIMHMAYREMDMRMAACIGRSSKEDRVETILMSVSIPISKREVCLLVPDVSEAYVELVIGRMLKEGRIERIGARKNSRYIPVGSAEGSRHHRQ